MQKILFQQRWKKYAKNQTQPWERLYPITRHPIRWRGWGVKWEKFQIFWTSGHKICSSKMVLKCNFVHFWYNDVSKILFNFSKIQGFPLGNPNWFFRVQLPWKISDLWMFHFNLYATDLPPSAHFDWFCIFSLKQGPLMPMDHSHRDHIFQDTGCHSHKPRLIKMN